MLYLIHGTDQKKAREKLHSLADSLRAKRADAAYFVLYGDNFSEAKLEELIGGQGLFSQKYIVVMDRLLEEKEAVAAVLEQIKEIAGSENIFLMIEERLDKKILTKLEKVSEKILNFDSKESKRAADAFNVFDFADAFAVRDKKKMWILLQEAKKHDISVEEVHRILVWSVKCMVLAEDAKTVQESGLKPFVFNKSKRNAQNFKKGELKDISVQLIDMYHRARRGIVDMENVLEEFILS